MIWVMLVVWELNYAELRGVGVYATEELCKQDLSLAREKMPKAKLITCVREDDEAIRYFNIIDGRRLLKHQPD